MKDRFNGTRLAFIIAIVLSLSACISHQRYRTESGLCISANPLDECAQHSLQVFQSPNAIDEKYHLGFVEFDDQGQLWDREQLREVIGQVNTLAANQDLLMVVFVQSMRVDHKGHLAQQLMKFNSLLYQHRETQQILVI